MSLELILKKIESNTCAAVVVLVILALVLSGVGSAERLLCVAEPDDTEVTSTEQVNLVPGADSEEEAGDMATGGQPWTEQVATLKGSLQLLPSSNQFRLARQKAAGFSSLPNQAEAGSLLMPTRTRSEVCWSLGRQFTLVGAKPSGTS